MKKGLKKPRLKLNPRLALIGLQTTGPCSQSGVRLCLQYPVSHINDCQLLSFSAERWLGEWSTSPISLFSLHFIISALYHPKLTQIKTRQYLWQFLFLCAFLNLSCSFFFKQFSPLEVLKQTPLVKASPYPSSLFCLHSPRHHFCSLPPKVSTNENKTIFMAISIILNCTF